MLIGAVGARIQGESIDGDLQQLERHNAAIRTAQTLRRQTLDGLLDESGELRPVETLATPVHWRQYVVMRSAADASRLRTLLDDPVVFLGHDPFPYLGPHGDSLWLAPLASWRRPDREVLEQALAMSFSASLEPIAPVGPGAVPDREVLRVGLASLRRSIDLVIEWSRGLTAEAQQAAKRHVYELRDAVAQMERSRRMGWVTIAGLTPPEEGPPSSAERRVLAWCDRAVEGVDRLVVGTGALVRTSAGPPTQTAWEGYWTAAGALLDAAVRTHLGEPVDPLTPSDEVPYDIRERVMDALDVAVTELLVTDPAPAPVTSPTALTDRILRSGWGRPTDRLALIEVLSLAEHLTGSRLADPIDFVRISAAADTPLATDFATLRRHSDAIGDEAGDEWVGREDFLRPEVKLAGNELSNFSAFLQASWRDNDWMWGRLDAASGLIDLLLGTLVDDSGEIPAPILTELADLAGLESGASRPEVRRQLIRTRQLAILAELGLSGGMADYDVGLETLTRPGSSAIQQSAVELVTVASHVLREELPPGRARCGRAPRARRPGGGQLAHPPAWRSGRPDRRGGGPAGRVPSADRLSDPNGRHLVGARCAAARGHRRAGRCPGVERGGQPDRTGRRCDQRAAGERRHPRRRGGCRVGQQATAARTAERDTPVGRRRARRLCAPPAGHLPRRDGASRPGAAFGVGSSPDGPMRMPRVCCAAARVVRRVGCRQLVSARPAGLVKVRVPSASPVRVQPPSWTRRWWAQHSPARLGASVGPWSRVHQEMWWTWRI